MTCFRDSKGVSYRKKLKDLTSYALFYRRVDEGQGLEQAYEEARKVRGKGSKLNRTKYWLPDGSPVRSHLTETKYKKFMRLMKVMGYSLEQAYEEAKENKDGRTRQRTTSKGTSMSSL